MTTPTTFEDIQTGYETSLEKTHPELFKLYTQRKKTNPEGCRSEVTIFSLFQTLKLNPKLYETPGDGGVDFICGNKPNEFLVEVSMINSESITKHSHINREFEANPSVFSFSSVTELFRRKASHKSRQMSDSNHPRLLAITTEHSGGDVLFGGLGPIEILNRGIASVSFSDRTRDYDRVREHKDPIFYNLKNGQIEYCLQSISALLLAHVLPDSCTCGIVGVIHPKPAIPFPVNLLEDIPFAYIKNWPSKTQKFEIGFTTQKTSAIYISLESIHDARH